MVTVDHLDVHRFVVDQIGQALLRALAIRLVRLRRIDGKKPALHLLPIPAQHFNRVPVGHTDDAVLVGLRVGGAEGQSRGQNR